MRHSPLQLARIFEEIKGKLRRAPVSDSKLLILINYWPDLKDDLISKSYQSYLQEYTSLLKHYFIAESLLDLKISEIDVIITVLENLTKIDPGLELDKWEKLALRRLATLYLYVGEVEPGLNACQRILGREIDKGIDLENAAGLSEYENFEAICHHYEKSDSRLHEILLRIKDEWKSKSRGLDYDIAFCLFVEKDDSGNNMRGRMRTLKASVELVSKTSPDDKVTFDNQTKSPDDPFVGSVYNSLKAVRKVIGRYGHKEASKRFYNAHFSIENSKQTFTGDSIGLAAGLVTFVQLLKDQIISQEHFLSGECAFTGRVDADGKITAVKEDSLSKKIGRAFFSHVKYLALPEANIRAGQEIRDSLRQQYPKRQLKLIPLEWLSEALCNRNIIITEKVCLLNRVSRGTRKYSRMAKVQVPILGILVVILAAFTAIQIDPRLSPCFDWHIAGINVIGNQFQTVNSKGQRIWDSQKLSQTLTRKKYENLNEAYKHFLPVDKNGNGREELFLSLIHI